MTRRETSTLRYLPRNRMSVAQRRLPLVGRGGLYACLQALLIGCRGWVKVNLSDKAGVEDEATTILSIPKISLKPHLAVL